LRGRPGLSDGETYASRVGTLFAILRRISRRMPSAALRATAFDRKSVRRPRTFAKSATNLPI
jgi:hypothetical protein